MAKYFFDVFPVLQVNEEMKKILTDMEVQRVVSNRQRTRLRVYLSGERLIHKKNIFQLERNIKTQLFPKQEMTVKIIEKYRLSAQYTPQTLFDIYKDSILEEIRAYSLVLYNIFRCADPEFDEPGHMRLHLEDTFLIKERSEELLEILYKIICDRCGLPVVIEPVFEKKQKEKQKDRRPRQGRERRKPRCQRSRNGKHIRGGRHINAPIIRTCSSGVTLKIR